MTAFESGRDFKSVLAEQPEIAGAISGADLDSWLDPARYLGSAVEKVGDVLRAADDSQLLERV